MRAHDVWKIYRRGDEEVVALQSVSLSLSAGTFSFVIGPSGGGKSTLLHLLGAIDRPTRGSVVIDGTPLEHAGERLLARFRRQRIGFVFQFNNLLPALDAVENVALPLLANGWKRRPALQRAEQHLTQVGLEHRLRHKPGQLSGGEQQRVAVVRAIISEPSLVLADEPTGELDADSRLAVIGLMREMNQRLGITFLVATHDVSLCTPEDRVWSLRNGLLAESPQ